MVSPRSTATVCRPATATANAERVAAIPGAAFVSTRSRAIPPAPFAPLKSDDGGSDAKGDESVDSDTDAGLVDDAPVDTATAESGDVGSASAIAPSGCAGVCLTVAAVHVCAQRCTYGSPTACHLPTGPIDGGAGASACVFVSLDPNTVPVTRPTAGSSATPLPTVSTRSSPASSATPPKPRWQRSVTGIATGRHRWVTRRPGIRDFIAPSRKVSRFPV